MTFNYLGKDYPIRISQAPSAPINGIVPMVAALPRSGTLQYGAVGTVAYSLNLANGALIPIAALQVNEDQNYVYAIEGGKVAARPITILAESGTTAAVSGIAEGTQVVLNPPPGLLPGSAVQAVDLSSGAAATAAPSAGAPAAGASASGGARKGPPSTATGSTP